MHWMRQRLLAAAVGRPAQRPQSVAAATRWMQRRLLPASALADWLARHPLPVAAATHSTARRLLSARAPSDWPARYPLPVAAAKHWMAQSSLPAPVQARLAERHFVPARRRRALAPRKVASPGPPLVWHLGHRRARREARTERRAVGDWNTGRRRIVGGEPQRSGNGRQTAERCVVDSEFGEHAEAAAQHDDRAEQRRDHQADIWEHDTSLKTRARSRKQHALQRATSSRGRKLPL
jgi:hypothetical protein